MSGTKRKVSSSKTLHTLQQTKVAKHNRPFFREQVLRLAAAQFFPPLDEGVKELVDCLLRVSGGDENHARRIVDRALRNSRTCPSPADLDTIASEVGTADVPRGCVKCEGTGFRYVTKTVTVKATGETYQADCQERCDCELGVFLAFREAERKHMERSA